ncbi:MAG TPA: type IV conjugative transfer system protein TraL [Bacteroidia bacterium]|nr:type IV conjugative transfer system protein TraL [Bacteroidia bacterium]
MLKSHPRGFFPRYIDRPRLIGIFEVDEFMVVFGFIFVVIFGSLALPDLASGVVMPVSIIGGLVSGVIYKRFKRGRPNGYTMQLLYKKGIIHPEESPTKLVSHPYLKYNRCVPYGFTKELIS